MPSKNKHKILRTLTKKSVNALIKGDVYAVVISNFAPLEVCKKLVAWYIKHPEKANYTHEVYLDNKPIQVDYGVTRIGFPYNLIYGKSKDSLIFKNYYKVAHKNIIKTRKVCHPNLSPIDKLLLKLGKTYGAQIAHFDGKPMFVGIGRITRPNAKRLATQPHFDSLPKKYKLDGQLSAIIYLKVPNKGGELELWNHDPLTPEEIANISPKKNLRSELGKSFYIKPKLGELILINTRRGHAVYTYQKGTRITISCFIGYIKGEPLLLWS